MGERHRPHWSFVSVDVVGTPDYRIDLERDRPLPFPSASLSVIYSAHTLEHLSYEAAGRFFDEASRCLRLGGELLLDVPNAEKAFQMLELWIANPRDIRVQRYLRPMGSGFSDEAVKSRVEFHWDSNAPVEWGGHPLVMIHNAIIACYRNPAYTGSCHVPVLIDPQVIESKVKTLEYKEYCEWALSCLPDGYRMSGGHQSAWSAENLQEELERRGFDVALRFHGESKSLPSRLVPDHSFLRRDQWSIKVQGIRNN